MLSGQAPPPPPVPAPRGRETPRWKRLAWRAAGVAVCAASVAFLALKAAGHWSDLVGLRPGPALWISLAAGSVAYLAAGFALAGAWQQLLCACGQEGARWSKVWPIYARSQVAKYIPGNVVHFPVRHALGRAEGWADRALVGAALLEILFLVTVAACLAAPGLSASRFPGVPEGLWLWALLGGVLGAAATVWVIRRRAVVARAANLAGAFAGAAFFHGLFFAGAALALWAAAAAAGGPERLAPLPALSVAATAWVVGFLAPGAPGGLGVREAVVTAALAPSLGDAHALWVALLFRTASLVGDGLFFAASWLRWRREPRVSPPPPA